MMTITIMFFDLKCCPITEAYLRGAVPHPPAYYHRPICVEKKIQLEGNEVVHFSGFHEIERIFLETLADKLGFRIIDFEELKRFLSKRAFMVSV